jgi:hypothetical protein
MANLTYRSVKGSPLTNDELDNNFSYFTGSHTVSGTLTTTGGVVTSGSILISGSIIPNVAPGNLTSSFNLGSPTAAWKDIYVSEGSIKFIASGSQTVISATPTGISVNGGPTLTGGGFSGSVSNTGSITNSGSVSTIGSSNTTGSSNTSGSVNTTGSVNTSGSVNTVGTTSTTGSSTISGSFSSVGNSTFTGSVAITGSPVIAGNLIVSGSLTVSGSNTIVNIGSLTTGDAANIAKNDSTAQGEAALSSGSYSHAEGSYSTTLGYASHAEGTSNTGLYAWDTTSTTNGLIQLATSVGNITSSFPNGTPILLDNSGTIYKYAVSNSFFAASRTQIQLTNTSVNYGSVATISLYSQISSPSTQLTNQTQILGGNTAHSEGYSTIALGSYSHAEGELNTALGYASHVEGNGTISQGDYQHVQGLYNITSSTAGAFILGNGTDDSNRKNLIFAAGNNVQISGSLLVSGSVNSNDFDSYFNLVRVGQGPVVGSANTILGETALNSATAGAANNTVIGNAALFANTTGLNNTIVGAGTALSNTTGSRNTALGAAALLLHNSDDNTAIGWNSLLGITSGYRNTALGTAAGNNISSTSFGNVYIGYNAGPTSSLVENNKLYINNTSSVAPLIGGDFSTGVATINSILQLQRRTTNPGLPIEGMIMASGSAGSSKLFYYNGTAWVDLTA